MTGFFLTIEGVEGVGKSTALKFIQNYLLEAKKNFITTREPGGTFIAEEIRRVLLTPSNEEVMEPETELLLMFASRAQLIKKIILPSLQKGMWVISDRFVDASFAYQGSGRGLDVAYIEMLEKWIVADAKPNLTLLLDALPELGLTRAKNRGSQDRIEQEKIDFFEKVRAGYLMRAQKDKQRFCVIDASQPLEKVQQHLKSILDGLMISEH